MIILLLNTCAHSVHAETNFTNKRIFPSHMTVLGNPLDLLFLGDFQYLRCHGIIFINFVLRRFNIYVPIHLNINIVTQISLK